MLLVFMIIVISLLVLWLLFYHHHHLFLFHTLKIACFPQVLSEILDSMTNITFKTTWSEAQQMLIDNPTFAEDTDLLSEFVFFHCVFVREREKGRRKKRVSKRYVNNVLSFRHGQGRCPDCICRAHQTAGGRGGGRAWEGKEADQEAATQVQRQFHCSPGRAPWAGQAHVHVPLGRTLPYHFCRHQVSQDCAGQLQRRLGLSFLFSFLSLLINSLL